METDLLTRQCDSIKVELHYGNGNLAVCVIDGNSHVATIPANPENWKEIFDHPFLFIPKTETAPETNDATELDGLELWHTLRNTKAHATDSESDWQ